MSKRFRRGLVVGKFAPLHLGHELVIRRALAECEDVVILSYCKPELPGCPPARRAQWLEARFPEARRLVVSDADFPLPADDADPAQHREFCAFLCREVLGVQVDAVFTSESYGDDFARHLTHYFRASDARAPVVEHVPVDAARREVPISATMLRQNVHAHRNWLAPEVYASFVERVCVLGGESSGKTTLAAALANSFETVCVPEFGRELWEAKAGKLCFEDLQHIAEVQITREEAAALRANRFLFGDTSPLTTLFYSHHMFGTATPALEQMAGRSYHLAVLCDTDFTFVQDGTRQPEDFRVLQHEWYLRELVNRRQRFVLASGSVEARVDQVRSALAAPNAA